MLGHIRKAGQRATGLTQQLLAFSRKQVLQPRVLDLSAVVAEATPLLRQLIGEDVELVCTPAAGLSRIKADPGQLEQVIVNLCVNARDAIREGGGSGAITIETRNVELGHKEAASHDEVVAGPYVLLAVSDTGTGMDPATVARMFEPFFTTKPPGKGTGLGLAVVHGILRDHDAVLQVESAPGAGSTFAIYFPAVAGAASSAAAVAAHPVQLPRFVSTKSAHILYVDDDEMIAFLMERLLQREGYRVTVFTHAQRALVAVRDPAQKFDLVISDYNMPGMSGLDFARAVKALRPDTPLAITSGYISEELRAQAPAAGVSELIYKPNTVEELFAAVDRLAQAVLMQARQP
jgi:CheY-like chemotaxis protein